MINTDCTNATQSSSMCQILQLPEASYDVVMMSLVLSYLPTPEQRSEMVAKARKLLKSPIEEKYPLNSVTLCKNDSGEVEKDSINAGMNALTPHSTGLLLIIEKQSIFSYKRNKNKNINNNMTISDFDNDGTKHNNISDHRSILYNWKSGISSMGFELVKYRLLAENKQAHAFAFKTINSNDSSNSVNCANRINDCCDSNNNSNTNNNGDLDNSVSKLKKQNRSGIVFAICNSFSSKKYVTIIHIDNN